MAASVGVHGDLMEHNYQDQRGSVVPHGEAMGAVAPTGYLSHFLQQCRGAALHCRALLTQNAGPWLLGWISSPSCDSGPEFAGGLGCVCPCTVGYAVSMEGIDSSPPESTSVFSVK